MKRLLHKVQVAGAALLLLFFIALPASAQEPLIKIGVSLGLTGKYSEMSDMQMKGFKLWESNVNKRGGPTFNLELQRKKKRLQVVF